MNLPAAAAVPAQRPQRWRLSVRGQVQGVGFRPQVYRTALALQLTGFVRNDGDGVTIEVEGARSGEFAAALRADLPPLARIDALETAELPPRGERGFRIARSAAQGGDAVVPADVALCERCLRELFDPADRRYGHPFIACCDCGPRYSMARALPYDRANTAMAAFPLCPACAGEYRDPAGRRLHAEPIACHDCGPRLSHSPARIAAALRAGRIVALKGVGGYHLACDAQRGDVVERLRRGKRRDGRPFAVMLLNAASAATQLRLDTPARALLEGPQRPVLVLPRARGCDLPPALAPGLDTLGVLLPYTPLHYLLFHELLGRPEGMDWLQAPAAAALVMTSANRSGDPLLADDGEAAAALEGVADLVVSHDRHIAHACDDSVLRGTASGAVMLRRGRGFAPGALQLARRRPPVLALGAQLKNTVCALRADQAFLSAHIGDLDSPATQALLRRSADELLQALRLVPQAIACDLHPDYASSRLAQALAESLQLPLLPVQHHHAHIAAVAAARRHEGPLLGLALDGHGMGSDGGNWGGELLALHGARCRRLGGLRPIALPGGDRAAREPWRIALALAAELGREEALRERLAAQPLREAVLRLARAPQCPRTSAAGRYFDAAAALLAICDTADFEAAAPMRLESRCRGLSVDRGLFRIDGAQLDLHPLFDRLLDCDGPESGSALFHGTLIEALCAWVLRGAADTGLRTVALGGGCLLNAVLYAELPRRLRAAGLEVLLPPRELTPGDGGVALGQAWVAARTLEDGADARSRPAQGG